MNINEQMNSAEEIDLGVLFKKINSFFGRVSFSIFKMMFFVKRNIILLAILLLFGGILGYFLDFQNKSYKSEIIVATNFGSTDYLYGKVDLISSKISNRDYTFFKSLGIKAPQKLSLVEVEPIVDIYNFVNNNTAIATNAQNTQNFELVKLLSESGDINKVIKEKTTSRNYQFHTLKVVTNGYTSNEELIQPLLKYLNSSSHFQKTQKAVLANSEQRIKKDQEIINQIDLLINDFINSTKNNQKSDKLVYYNENTQLNEILKTKNDLIRDIEYKNIDIINYKKTINDVSSVLNIKNTSGINGKMKFVLPIFFIFIFILYRLFRSFYIKQASKLNK